MKMNAFSNENDRSSTVVEFLDDSQVCSEGTSHEPYISVSGKNGRQLWIIAFYYDAKSDCFRGEVWDASIAKTLGSCDEGNGYFGKFLLNKSGNYESETEYDGKIYVLSKALCNVIRRVAEEQEEEFN